MRSAQAGAAEFAVPAGGDRLAGGLGVSERDLDDGAGPSSVHGARPVHGARFVHGRALSTMCESILPEFDVR